jgi:hypothetical protein
MRIMRLLRRNKKQSLHVTIISRYLAGLGLAENVNIMASAFGRFRRIHL